MRKLLASVLAAGALLAATVGSALMAPLPVAGATCSSDQGQVLVSFIYDSSQNPPPITTVDVVNNDSQSVVVGVTFYSLSDTSTVVWSGSASFPVGTTVIDVSGLNQHMVSHTGKFGTGWIFPFIVSCA